MSKTIRYGERSMFKKEKRQRKELQKINALQSAVSSGGVVPRRSSRDDATTFVSRSRVARHSGTISAARMTENY